MRLLLKIGGAALEEPAARARFAAAVARARRQGHAVVLVHGGGNQIRALAAALGLEARYHEGLRITDARTAEVVLLVLGGGVNRMLVRSLAEAGVAAVGLTGADGGVFRARPLVVPGVDLGYVGELDEVRPELLRLLLEHGYTPVLATVAPGRRPARARPGADAAPFFNLNADHVVGGIAAALECDAILFLTDVPGVLDERGARIATLDGAGCRGLIARGVATRGMLPKLDAALCAARQNPRALVKIVPAEVDDAVLRALDDGTGTRFVASAADAEECDG